MNTTLAILLAQSLSLIACILFAVWDRPPERCSRTLFVKADALTAQPLNEPTQD